MSLLQCLIIDDEPIARRILVDYCGQVPDLEVVGVKENAVDAWHFIQNGIVDLIFLDIEMPHLDGLRLVSALKPTPFVVFTTAFTEYAVTAFELAASDYLLKPFSFERFLVAVNRVMNQRQSRPGTGNDRTESEFIFIKAEGKIFQLRYDDILYAEAGGNYSTLVTKSGRLQPNMAFSNLEDMLPAGFVRVHRSYIINRSQISYIEGHRIFIAKKEIPIGNNYRDAVFKKLGLDS